jgi:hypothetical protein
MFEKHSASASVNVDGRDYKGAGQASLRAALKSHLIFAMTTLESQTSPLSGVIETLVQAGFGDFMIEKIDVIHRNRTALYINSR